MRKTLLPLSLCLLLAACSSDEPDTPAAPARRTVLVYMVATNSLGANERDQQDLDEMDRAVTADGLNGCRWLVYRVAPGEQNPTLFEIKKNKHGTAVHEVLEVYPSTQCASVTAERMSEVIADARRHAPAQDYGLVLWSHATGWAPSLTTKAAAPRRVFGEDNGATMPLHVLAGGFPVDWSLYPGDPAEDFIAGNTYDFHAIVRWVSNGGSTSAAPRRAEGVPSEGRYMVFPLEGGDGLVTAVTAPRAEVHPVGVTYVNVMGMMSSKPFPGLNIEVTHYSDGTTSSEKRMIKQLYF